MGPSKGRGRRLQDRRRADLAAFEALVAAQELPAVLLPE
jgi:hypothetical protein